MRCFQPPADTRFYAGVDLHARALFLVVLDQDGRVVVARNLPAAPEPFLRAVAPFRDGLLVACECMHCWYWLADTCREQHIAFVLGHAYSMRAVHGYKTKCDRKDAEAIARLLKGGNFPPAYAYPKERRGLRDLLRARLRDLSPDDAGPFVVQTDFIACATEYDRSAHPFLSKHRFRSFRQYRLFRANRLYLSD